MNSMRKYTQNRKETLLTVVIIAILLALLGLCSCAVSEIGLRDEATVRVALVENEGIELLSNKYVDVVPGKNAEFLFNVRDGYIYAGNSENAYYDPKKGCLTLSVVHYPTSIEIYLLDTGSMNMLELASPLGAQVSHNGDDKWFDDGETVTVTAKENSRYDFVGWSLGDYIENGGTIISKELSYTFDITEGTKLFANYRESDQYTLIYHANGGKVKGGETDTYVVKGKLGAQFTCANTIYSNGTFVRSGYVAVGYSTEPVNFEDYASVNDIPGFSNMGGICVIPEDTGTLDLYVVWAKATPTEDFRIEASGATITKYTGSSEIVVIPETIMGKTVTTIKANAFVGGNVKTVVIPKGVKTIENNAFNSCTKLTQVVFFDGVTQVRNASFQGCNKISTIVLNSQMLPHYSGTTEGTFCIKYQRVKTAPGKMLVVVAGSSTLYGMDSTEFQKAYPDYTIVNYGTNAGTPSYFYLKVISNYVGEGDIIIQAGEHGSTTMGSNSIQWKLFRGNEQSYDIFREVDMTEFTNFWDAFYEFQWFGEKDSAKQESVTVRTLCSTKPYQTVCSQMNEYGDLITTRTKNESYDIGNYDFRSPDKYLSSQNASRLNSVARIIEGKGGIILGSFATLDERCVVSASRKQSVYDTYTAYFDEMLSFPVISNVGTYTMAKEYFNNSMWHCTTAGAALRTQNLLNDLDTYLSNNQLQNIKLELVAPNASLVSHNGTDNRFTAGEKVTVIAVDSDTYDFLGWSIGGYISNGGTLLTSEAEYTFTIADSIVLYANYRQSDKYTIVYHANGGSISGQTEDTMIVVSNKGTQFTCRNTIHSNGTFVRDGYIAVGYSTTPVNFEDYACVNDIPGFSNMGGICVVPEVTGVLDLYVVWAKETSGGNFEFTVNGNQVTLKKYKGSGSVVVIPEKVAGMSVTTISAGAFKNSTVKNVVIPRTMKTIENGAFDNCPNLTQVVFFDGVTQVRNDSFRSCNKISTIVLNAQMLPHYAGTGEGTFCIKYERVKTAPGKMLVVVSGSSTLNGMDSTQFQAAYPDYTIINYGTNAGTPSYFYLKVIANYVGEGDIIIHAGEHGSTTMGSNSIQWKLFRGNEQSYDIFREVDMTEFTNFWDAFYEFQWFGEKDPAKQATVTVRTLCSTKPYQTPCTSMNEYGDLITTRSANRNYSVSANVDFLKPSNYLSAANAARLNSVAEIIASKGGVMLGSFATMDVRCVTVQSRNRTGYDTYNKYFADNLNYAIISDVATYTMDQKYFYDSQWHCTNEGADIRTKNLLADLAAYLKEPNKY